MSREIFQLKPSLYGIGIDLRALYRHLVLRSDVSVVVACQARRLLELFRAHRLQPAHIPRLIRLSYSDLKDDDALLSAITPELIDTTAALFGVRPEWLGGIDDEIYELRYCYKSPHHLLDLVESLGRRASPVVRCVTTTKKLDKDAGLSQRMELVVVEVVAQIGEMDVHRYHPFTDGWDWSETACRWQLKAMVRALGGIVPLYEVGRSDIDAWYDRKRFPSVLMCGPFITSPSLEDYSLSVTESRVSKESEELPQIEQYIAEHSLLQRVKR